MGVSATRARNGVLIFLVPRRRKVVVLGDAGIHAKVAPDFWDRVVERITADFRRGDPTAGMVAAVELLGNALASAFPASAADVNELPNTVSVD
jgi:putative membrane protein